MGMVGGPWRGPGITAPTMENTTPIRIGILYIYGVLYVGLLIPDSIELSQLLLQGKLKWHSLVIINTIPIP